MFDRWRHALSITPALAASLSELERRSEQRAAAVNQWDAGLLSQALSSAWRWVVNDTRSGRFELSPSYLSKIHCLMAGAAGTEAPGDFAEVGIAAPMSWNEAISLASPEVPGFDHSYTLDAVILTQLRWCGHVRSLGLALGWLCMNGLHLRDEAWTIVPPPDDRQRLLEYLAWAGPPSWDFESLRALLGEYAEAQKPC